MRSASVWVKLGVAMLVRALPSVGVVHTLLRRRFATLCVTLNIVVCKLSKHGHKIPSYR